MKLKLYTLTILLFVCIGVSKGQKKFDSGFYPLHAFQKSSSKPLLLYLTGDGGWNSLSQAIVSELNSKGYAVIALDTRNYFWSQKTPAGFGDDAEVILKHYLEAWNKSSFSIVGYSFGADVGAFLPANLSDGLSKRLKSMVLLSPGFSTGFVTKISNMLGFGGSDKDKYKVYPQLLKCEVPVRCIFGKDEGSDFYQALKPTEKIQKIMIPGSHKYNDDAGKVVAAVLPGL
jgi:type IV secretory pathway VirJ component